MKHATNARRALLASFLAGSTIVSTGCSSGRNFSMSSMNPFAKSATESSEPAVGSTMTESIASTAAGAGNQVRTIGASAKNAIGKSTTAMTSVFRRNTETADDQTDLTDPLRLDNKPKTVDPEVFVANGQLWESTGDLTKAMSSYTKALENSPNHVPALANIGRIHFRQGNLEKSAEFFKRAIALDPQDAVLHNDLGLTLNKMGDQAAAIASLEQALRLAPGTSRYANNLASVKFESGDAAAAQQVLAQNNKPAVAHFNMAYLHFKSGQIDRARGHIGEALRFEPQAASDPAVKRAIERSRDMLAQIDASTSPVAQAAPQASSAAGQFAGNLTNPASIQQTSQSESSAGKVTPAASMGPAMTAIGLPTNQVSAQSPASPLANTTPAVSPQANTAPAAWKQAWNQAVGQATSNSSTEPAVKPTRPTESTQSTSTEDVAFTEEEASTSGPFVLPSGFTMPEGK